MRLLVASHVIHYQWQNRLWAFGGYAREIEIWAELFSEVIIASPLRHEEPPGDHLPFEHNNIRIRPIAERGGDYLTAKIRQLFSLPGMIVSLCRSMRTADAIHVRCPGNIGLLASILAPLFSKYRIAKYAGQWNGYKGEGFPTWLQRQILKSHWWNAPVTVYGHWPDQPAHVVPFFTSMMTRSQTNKAYQFAQTRSVHEHFKILFVGRLTYVKRVHILLEAFAILIEQHPDAQIVVIGDGPERGKLEEHCKIKNLMPYVKFVGALPYQEVLHWYEWGDCLVLPSNHSEGWPKVVAEAMCYGVHCVAVRHGQVPTMLEGRGTLIDNGSVEELASALISLYENREHTLEIGKRASDWSSKYSLEYLKENLQQLLETHWHISLDVRIPNVK